jgi:hypothetical protein
MKADIPNIASTTSKGILLTPSSLSFDLSITPLVLNMIQPSSPGLSNKETEAYEACRKFSCVHEACISKWSNTIDKPRRSKEKCGVLHDKWKECFALVMKEKK